MSTTEIELVGGQLDGRTMLLSPGQDGLPVERLEIPVALLPNTEGISAPLDNLESTAFTRLRYQRSVFAEARHRWLYQLMR